MVRPDGGATRRGQRHATGPAPQPSDPCSLVDGHTSLTGDSGDPAAQLRGIEQDIAPGRAVQAGVPQG